MRLPFIQGRNRYSKTTIAFGGLNMKQSYSEGELCDCNGISHLSFPAITQRQKSEVVFRCNSPGEMIFSSEECIAAEDALYYGRKKVADLLPGKKMLAVLGEKIAVFPDKIFFDTRTEKVQDMQGACSTKGATVTFENNFLSVPSVWENQSICVEKHFFRKNEKIITYESAEIKNAKPVFYGFNLKDVSELSEGLIYLEDCESNQYRKVLSVLPDEVGDGYTITNELATVTNAVKDLFSGLKDGDFVEISGCVSNEENNLSAQIVTIEGNKIIFPDETFSQCTENSDITVKRKIPDFSCVCSYGNRLWGCEGNTVYASALGDMTNFFTYRNLSTDSFSVDSNSPGKFTACVPFGNCCLFFKENSCYKLYGNKPSNFTLTETYGGGISPEDKKSLVYINGKVIYKGNGGVYVCYGGTPRNISGKLEGIIMKNAACGSDGKRFYISADVNGKREEFVWDMEKELWSKSGVADVIGYSYFGGIMYRMLPYGVEKILEEPDGNASWSITLCPFDENYHKTKNYSRLYVRAGLFENASITVEVSCDEGMWKEVYSGYSDRKKYIDIPCVIKSCHSVKLRISGKGKCVLESVTREFSIN